MRSHTLILSALCSLAPACARHDGAPAVDAASLPLTPLPWVQADGALAGTVRDLAGAPLAGAEVCAWDLAVRHLAHVQAPPHCAIADARGEFELRGLASAPYSLHASAATFQPAEFAHIVPLRAGERRADLQLALAPGGARIDGVVVDATGVPIAGAWVSDAFVPDDYGVRPPGPIAAARTDADGRFTLWGTPGGHVLVAGLDALTGSSAAAPGSPARIVLERITTESAIRGQVLDTTTGQPVGGARVLAYAGQRFDHWAVRAAITDPAGQFELHLSRGRYTVLAETGNRQGEADREIILGAGETRTLRPVMLSPLPSARGRVVVVDPETGSEAGCPRGYVTLRSGFGTDRWEGIGADGEVFFPALEPGDYQVSITCPGLPPADDWPILTVGKGPLAGLRWELSARRALRGTVVDRDGRPVAGRSVTAHLEGDDPYTGQAETDSAGRFEILGAGSGSYVVEVDAQPDARAVVEVRPGRDVDGIRLVAGPAPFGALRVRVVDARGEPVLGATVVIHDSPEPHHALTGGDGAFEVQRLRPDVYRITAERPCPAPLVDAFGSLRDPPHAPDVERRVRVDGNDVVEVDLVLPGSSVLCGRVVRGGAPLAGVSVAAGQDLRFGLGGWWGGRPVATDQDGRFALTGLSDRCTYTLRASTADGGEGVVNDARVGGDVTLAIEETVTLAGRLVGTPPEAFSIWLVDLRAGDQWLESMHSRVFRRTAGRWGFEGLPPGEYELRLASRAGRVQARVTLAPGEHLEDLSLEFTTPGGVRGRVLDAAGEPVAGAAVSVGYAEPQPSIPGGGDSSLTDQDGRFEIAGISPGGITVSTGELSTQGVQILPRRFTELTLRP